MEVSVIDQYKCARKTLIEMLYDRNYTITKPENQDESSKELYMKMGMESSEMIAESMNDEDIVYVYFFFEKIGINEAKQLTQHLIENDYNHSIVVIDGGCTPFAEKFLISEGAKCNIDIEIFDLKKLLYNITKHELQPQINHINDKEKIKRIYKTFGITSREMNLNIRIDDPINKYYNGKKGDMYKVSYKGGRIEYVTVI